MLARLVGIVFRWTFNGRERKSLIAMEMFLRPILNACGWDLYRSRDVIQVYALGSERDKDNRYWYDMYRAHD